MLIQQHGFFFMNRGLQSTVFILILIVLGFAHNDLYSAAELTYKGEISFENWTCADDPANSNQTNTNNTAEIKFEGVLTIDFFKILIAPKFKMDFSERGRNRFLLDEGWIQLGFSSVLDFRLGIQLFTWGMVESQSVVDILNTRDYEDDFLDPDKVGDLSARLRFLFLENFTFEFYLLAHFSKVEFPSTKGRYNLTNGVYNVDDNAVYGSSKFEEWYPQHAFRLNMTLDKVDLALSYFHGYHRFPVLNFEGSGPRPYYYLVDQIGLEFIWVIGKLLIKIEGVYRNTTRNDSSVIPNSLVPKSYFAYVGGFEYSFQEIIAKNDLTIILEYIGDSDVGKTTIDFRLFQNDLFVGLKYNFNDINNKQIKMGATFDMEYPEEFVFLIEYSQRFKEDFTFHFRLDGVHAKSGSNLDNFKEELRFKAKITYWFSSDDID